MLHDLLHQFGIGRAALLGMSAGGAIAVDYALTDPSEVEALVLMAAGFPGYPLSDETARLIAPVAEAFRAQDFPRAIDLTVRLWVDGAARSPDAVLPAVRERVRGMYADVLRRSRGGGRQPEPLQPPALDRLAEIRTRVLVVVGADDLPDVRVQAAMLAEKIPGAREIVVPDAAHLLNMEHPAEINRMVLEFLAVLNHAEP